ncbi:hypothetical protein [Pilimelia columellifera]|uniref:Uncharacterized protein n=1 Tax=Pilimelia columellifera subsp. columellifera TaxID=706583 RepID=A0ABN3NLC0_9ACTN
MSTPPVPTPTTTTILAAAPTSRSGEVEPPAPGGQRPGRLQITVALVLLVMFVACLVVLATMRDDPHWDRLVYLLSGFEAVVFAAVGAFFGVSIQRGVVAAARREADQASRWAAEAQSAAVQERAAADLARHDAAAGRVLAAAVAAADHPSNSRAVGDGARLAELARLADALFPAAPGARSAERDR